MSFHMLVVKAKNAEHKQTERVVPLAAGSPSQWKGIIESVLRPANGGVWWPDEQQTYKKALALTRELRLGASDAPVEGAPAVGAHVAAANDDDDDCVICTRTDCAA